MPTTFTAACGWPTGALVPPPPPQAEASNVNAATTKILNVGRHEWTRAIGWTDMYVNSAKSRVIAMAPTEARLAGGAETGDRWFGKRMDTCKQ